jgi:hypothetical protein
MRTKYRGVQNKYILSILASRPEGTNGERISKGEDLLELVEVIASRDPESARNGPNRIPLGCLANGGKENGPETEENVKGKAKSTLTWLRFNGETLPLVTIVPVQLVNSKLGEPRLALALISSANDTAWTLVGPAPQRRPTFSPNFPMWQEDDRNSPWARID